MSYKVVLYYKYLEVQDPEKELAEQREICEKLQLKGRIIISKEGLNATLGGAPDNVQAYNDWLTSRPGLQDTHLKISDSDVEPFPKLSVKVRPEIVSAHLGEDDLDPRQITGKYILAEDLHAWIHSKKEFYIIDMRNDYEHSVGHFEGSLLPPLSNFRDLPKVLPELTHLRDKTIVTVCTGGIRCEKASGFLVKHGFKDVYQLFGGIVTYMEKYPNQDFKGKLYVFDQRVTMGFNLEDKSHEIVGRCMLCGGPTEDFVNCAYDYCHKHFLCCDSCKEADGTAYCKAICRAHNLALFQEKVS